jgi:hypothetical protein
LASLAAFGRDDEPVAGVDRRHARSEAATPIGTNILSARLRGQPNLLVGLEARSSDAERLMLVTASVGRFVAVVGAAELADATLATSKNAMTARSRIGEKSLNQLVISP